jgi:hypothetical protein
MLRWYEGSVLLIWTCHALLALLLAKSLADYSMSQAKTKVV